MQLKRPPMWNLCLLPGRLWLIRKRQQNLQNEAPVELGQSGHGAADCAKLESQSSVGTTSLEQTSLQGLLAAERQHHEIASVLTASTVVLSVCFPQYIIAMPLIHLR
jgi:hypothetical protein